MSLSKFLAVGRSIVGLSNTSPYTVKPDSYLHRLAVERRNGVVRQSNLKFSGAPAAVREEKVAGPAAVSATTPVAVAEVKTKPEPSVTPPTRKNQQQTVSPFAPYKIEKPPGFWARWNPFRRRKQPVRNPVQAELRLEGVKVIRNDLTDADVEVIAQPTLKSVPAGSTPIPAAPVVTPIFTKKNPFRPESVEQPGASRPETGDPTRNRGAWGDVTAKLFPQKNEH